MCWWEVHPGTFCSAVITERSLCTRHCAGSWTCPVDRSWSLPHFAQGPSIGQPEEEAGACRGLQNPGWGASQSSGNGCEAVAATHVSLCRSHGMSPDSGWGQHITRLSRRWIKAPASHRGQLAPVPDSSCLLREPWEVLGWLRWCGAELG